MKCPTCGRKVEREGNPARPFCSERCQLIDLGRWVNEEYRVPASEPVSPLDNPQAPPTRDAEDDA